MDDETKFVVPPLPLTKETEFTLSVWETIVSTHSRLSPWDLARTTAFPAA